MALATTAANALTDVTSVQGKAEKVAKEEFGADFFKRNSYLKRRVALVHPKWDLTTFSGVESNF